MVKRVLVLVLGVAACAIQFPEADFRVRNDGTGGASGCGFVGYACGNDDVSGDPNTLYECSNGVVMAYEACANGCQVNPGVSDQCAAPCGANGSACATAADCCDNFCASDGTCGCVSNCVTNADCCTNFCNAGVCQM